MHIDQRILTAPLAHILSSGGDARLAIDARTGLNKFGCSPLPQPEMVCFGSSTASGISERAFAQIAQEHDLFLQSAHPQTLLAERTETLREEWKAALGLSPTSTEIIFSPSGTDSVLHALFVTRCRFGARPLDCILAASDETGTGVARALIGRHFSPITAEGVPVEEGGPIAGLAEDIRLFPLPVQDAQGRLRAPDDMDAEVLAAVRASVYAGRRVLLQVMDHSKLGARCPSRRCLDEIGRLYGDAVQIVVDACQMRISQARMRRHLSQGHLLLISGSKFFMGPPFSGALLVPPTAARRMSQVRDVPAGLGEYTNRLAWPPAWTEMRAALPDRASLGQYYRGRAALTEMQAYFAVPLAFRQQVLARFAAMTTELIQARQPDVSALATDERTSEDTFDDDEMAVRTIFPLRVMRQGRDLSFEEMRTIHAALNWDISADLGRVLRAEEQRIAAAACLVGQPVRIPNRGSAAGVLRLCAGARMVTDVWQRREQNPQALEMQEEQDSLSLVLDKITLLSRDLPALRNVAHPRNAGKERLEFSLA